MKGKALSFFILRGLLDLCLSWAHTDHGSLTPQMNIIILILGEDPNYGYYSTAPMYDVAFQHVGQIFPGLFANTTRHVLYKKNVLDCSSAAANMVELMGQVVARVDHSSGPTVLFSPGCSLEVGPLADLARGRCD
ncbi:hypothetical protein RvY_11489 [Ramazzottius varieornatus]|uniref:Receptor ligand binding region domain-containing protein n=1 Tax=Ramazzottius varieornatus TaxID=947166 RepID=A0A1D1VID2_RAMVA|nr:hypothetical protein RvY_11489 [Ramazzottius varieornatus]